MNNYSGTGSSVQSTSSAQGGGPDFGDLLHAYDVSAEGEQNDTHDVTEPSETLCESTTAPEENPSSLKATEPCSFPGNAGNMSCHSTVSPGDGSLDSRPIPSTMPATTHSVTEADTSAANSSTQGSNQNAQQTPPLNIDTSQESSLQTLSRFVEELSSPKPKVIFNNKPMDENEAEASSSVKLVWQVGNRGESASEKVSSPSSDDLVSCSREESIPETSVCRDGDISAVDGFRKETPVLESENSTEQTCGVSSNVSDGQSEMLELQSLVGVIPLSATAGMSVTTTGEEGLNTTNLSKFGIASGTELSVDSELSNLFGKAVKTPTVSSEHRSISSGLIEDSLLSESVLMDTHNSVSSSNVNTANNSSLSNSVADSSSQNSITFNEENSQNENVLSSGNGDPIISSVTNSNECSNSSRGGPSPAEVVSVLVTDSHLQTVHCMGGSQTEMLSFNIENVPDSSINDSESCPSERCTTEENNVTSSSPGVEYTHRGSESVNSSVNRSKDSSKSAFTLEAEKETVRITSSNSEKGQNGDWNEIVSTSFASGIKITPEGDKQKQVKRSVGEVSDDALQKRQQELGVSSQVRNLLEDSPVLMQCLGVDRPIVETSVSKATASSSVQMENESITSSSTSAAAREMLVASVSNGQPFTVIPSSTNQPFVIAPIGEPVLNPNSIQSSNPSPVGSASNNLANHSPPATTSSTKSSASTGRENKRKKKNPMRSQNYNTVSNDVPTQPLADHAHVMEHSFPQSIPDSAALPVQIKHEKPDGEWLGNSAQTVLNTASSVAHVPQDTLLPRISSVQSLHPGVIPLNILPQQPPTAPKAPRARNSKPRSFNKSSNKDSQSITSGPTQPNFSASQNLYNASNLMNHLTERAGMRNTGRPLGNYYPPINITPDNAPSGPPPPQNYPSPYMSHGPMRMTMPYMPPPPPPHFGNRPNLQVDRSAVHLDRGNFRMERPPATHMNRPGINLEQRHNMLQTTRPPFSNPFIDMGPQLGDIYYSQPPGMMIPPPRPLPQQPQHHPLRAPLVIRPDCPTQLNLQNQFRTSPDSSGAAGQSLTKRFTAPTSSVGNAAQQPSMNRNTFATPEAMKGKNGAMVFVPPRVISEASKTSISNTTSVSKTSTLGRNVKIAPKKPPTTVSSVVLKASVASSPISSAMKSANADPDPNRISSDILKEQKVKTYKPNQPPEHLGFKDTLKTCKCQGCGDEFLFSTSLVNHLDRKSIMIKYNCGECNKNIVFYNRCCLFIHAKGHAKGLKAYRLNINLATINVLPDDLLPSKETTMHVESEANIQKDKDKTVESDNDSTCTSVVGIKSPVQIVSSIKTPEKIVPKPIDLQVAASYTDYNPNYVTVSKNGKRMYKCVECKKLFPNVRLLQSHFSGKTTKTIGLYKCSKCLTNVIGTCASTAHMRIHSKEQPFVCPECGELITGNRDIFLKHLKQKCMHFQRTLLLKCKLCSSILLYDADTVATHYNEQHSMKYYKCLECPMAFKSEAPYKAHLATEHNSRGVHKLICKCPLCDTVFHQVCNIESHFRNDHWPSLAQDVFTAYKCLACVPKKVFNQRNAYIVHSVRAHGNTTVTEMCNECGKEFQNVDEMKLHRKLVHKDFEKVDDNVDELTNSLSSTVNGDPKGVSKGVFISLNDLVNGTEKPKSKGGIACEKCETTFNDLKTYEKHMEKHKFVEKRKLIGTRVPSVKVKKLKIDQVEKTVSGSTKSSKVEIDSKAQNQTEKEGSKSPKSVVEFHGQVPTAPTPKPRNKCSECPARFTGADELQEHLKIAHGMSPQYPCHLCGNTYESQILIERHIQMTHEGKSKDHPYFCWLCLETNIIKGYSSWKMLEKHLTGHHKLHKNNIDYSKFPKDVKEEAGDAESVSSRRSSLELDDTPVKRLKVAGDSLFNCAKCSFQADARDEFVQHITKHKPDDFSLQCLDCGLCFAVLPSLKRHLFAVHKVRDFAQYQEESGMDVEQANVDGSGLYSPQTSPLKLHVSQIPNGIAQPNLEKLEKKNETKKAEAVAEEPALECNVCYKTFDDDAARRKHMRMHGMAFIRSRRAAVPAWE